MPRKNQHVVPHSQGWAVKKEGSSRATCIFNTQEEAIEYGREIAINQRSELVIHNRKGEVRKRRNYKNHWSHQPYLYFPYLSTSQLLQHPSQNSSNHSTFIDTEKGQNATSSPTVMLSSQISFQEGESHHRFLAEER